MKLQNPGLRSALIKKAITITPNSGILDAIEVIQKYGIGRLVVIDRNFHPIGIITEKDIVSNLHKSNGKSIASFCVRDLMSKNLITAKKSDSIYSCAKLMAQNNISSLIIIHDDGSLQGIVTKTDLVFVFLIQKTETLPISKIMTKKIVTVSPNDSLFLVEDVLIHNKISRVPVSEDKKIVGIITYRDFVPVVSSNRLGVFTNPSELGDTRYISVQSKLDANQLTHLSTFKAKDIMTKNIVTVEPSDDVSLAALLMYRYGVSGIPVVKKSLLCGIVTKSDIVRAIASNDALFGKVYDS